MLDEHKHVQHMLVDYKDQDEQTSQAGEANLIAMPAHLHHHGMTRRAVCPQLHWKTHVRHVRLDITYSSTNASRFKYVPLETPSWT